MTFTPHEDLEAGEYYVFYSKKHIIIGTYSHYVSNDYLSEFTIKVCTYIKYLSRYINTSLMVVVDNKKGKSILHKNYIAFKMSSEELETMIMETI